MSKKFQITFNPRTGYYGVRELRVAYGVSKKLTGVFRGNFRTREEAERWIEAHGGWYGENEAHADAARKGHMRRGGY